MGAYITQLRVSVLRVCEFGGLEWWNGTVEWSTGLDYWSATPTNAQFGPTSMATNLIFKRYKAGPWQRIDELKTLHGLAT